MAPIAIVCVLKRPAVVQTSVASKPELDALCSHAKPTPVCGTRNGLRGCEAGLDLCIARFERGAVGHGLALIGGPCREL